MPSSNWTATNFLGGEWSPSAQGRFDDPRYRTALNVCFNSLPIEAGAWQRRSGTQNLGPSYKASPGCLRPFRLQDGKVVLVEITYTAGESASHLRFWMLPYTGPQFDATTNVAKNYALIPDELVNITDISTDTPALVTVDASEAWNDGDVIVLYIDPAAGAEQLNNRQVIITTVDDTSFTIADAYTGDDIDGSTINTFTDTGTNIAAHILTLDAPYTSDAVFDNIRTTQSGLSLYFAGGDDLPPYVMIAAHIPDQDSATPDITFSEVNFIDGPYDAPLSGTSQTGNDPGTVSATASTTPNLTTSYTFVDGDVGRQIRLWSQPAAYASASSYVAGNVVTYQGGWWTANNTVPAGAFPNGVAADANGKLYWLLTPQAGIWVYGSITAVAAGVATLSLNAGVPAVNGTTVDIWEIGVFRPGDYPTVVRFAQGRLWFGGSEVGRIDASMSGGAIDDQVTMSPTDKFGNVNDDNGIAAIFNLGAPFSISWLLEDRSGILIGTANGEYALQASALSDPITPTSIQVSKVSSYGCAPVEALRVGLADVFVQLDRKKLFEYLLDYFSQKFAGRHLNEYAKHLTAPDIREFVYTEEKSPVIWVRTGDGNFIGCTYRRDGSLLTQPPVFFGWHRHQLGSTRFVTSICAATPATRNAELVDSVAMLTKDGSELHTVEVLRPLYDDADSIEYGWLLDTAVIPGGTDQPTATPGPPPPVIVAGKYYFEVQCDALSHGHTIGYWTGGSMRFGFATAAADISGSIDQWPPNSIPLPIAGTYFVDQWFYYAGSGLTQLHQIGWHNGDILGFAVDTINDLLWIKNITTDSGWNSGPGGPANPATGVGGFSFAGIGSQAYFFFTGVHYGADDTASINTGQASFAGTPPAGFPALDVSGTFAFNFADTTPGAVLSDGNHTVDTGGDINTYSARNRAGVPFVWDASFVYHIGDYCTAGGAVFKCMRQLGSNLNPLGAAVVLWQVVWQGARANTGIPAA